MAAAVECTRKCIRNFKSYTVLYCPEDSSLRVDYLCVCVVQLRATGANSRCGRCSAGHSTDSCVPTRSSRTSVEWRQAARRRSCSSWTDANGVVRAFDVRSGRLDARDAYRRSDGNQSIVSAAYSARSDTLFVCTSSGIPLFELSVRSLARANAEWRECHCLRVGVGELFWVFGCAHWATGVSCWSKQKQEGNPSCRCWRRTRRVRCGSSDSSQTRVYPPISTRHSRRAAGYGWPMQRRAQWPFTEWWRRARVGAQRSSRAAHSRTARDRCSAGATVCSRTRALRTTRDGRCTSWASAPAGASSRGVRSSAAAICPALRSGYGGPSGASRTTHWWRGTSSTTHSRPTRFSSQCTLSCAVIHLPHFSFHCCKFIPIVVPNSHCAHISLLVSLTSTNPPGRPDGHICSLTFAIRPVDRPPVAACRS